MSGQETLSSVNGCHPIEKLTQNMSLSLDINAKVGSRAKKKKHFLCLSLFLSSNIS